MYFKDYNVLKVFFFCNKIKYVQNNRSLKKANNIIEYEI